MSAQNPLVGVGFAATVRYKNLSMGWKYEAPPSGRNDVHLAIAEVEPDIFLLVASPIVSYGNGLAFCANPPSVLFSFRITSECSPKICESNRSVTLAVPNQSGHNAEFIFGNILEFWSFVQEFAEARIACEKRKNDKAVRKEWLLAQVLATFPAHPLPAGFETAGGQA
ncbi:hypothetical protein OH77DRAFT_1592784 [Trametes cingulata]|nr:hypothetical protein OH77DRAFT_1592784 [Trametes cingulata]